MDTKALIQRNLDVVLDSAPDLAARFYAKLFQHHPELSSLFVRRPLAVQERMLLEAIAAVVDHLDDAPWLDQTLRVLGAKHVDYGVTDEMYAMVTSALIDTLRDASGQAWDEPTHQAWSAALAFVAERMQFGAREHAAATPGALGGSNRSGRIG